jgi:hypothetical protein
VFRDAETCADGKSVQLLDRDYETAAVIAAALALQSTCTLPIEVAGDEPAIRALAGIHAFATKWEMPAVSQALKINVRLAVLEGKCGPLVGFMFGALADDPDTAVAALRVAETRGAPYARVLDLLSWPVFAWSYCPQAYLGALVFAAQALNGFGSVANLFEQRLRWFQDAQVG